MTRSKKTYWVIVLALLNCAISIVSAQTFKTGIPVVRDSANRIVGPVVDVHYTEHFDPVTNHITSAFSGVTTIVFVDDVSFPLSVALVSGGEITGTEFHDLYFTTTDCSGTPYLSAQDVGGFSSVPPYAGNSSSGLTIYVAVPGATRQVQPVQSLLTPTGSCVPATYAFEVIEAIPISTGFTGPFTVSRGPSIATASMALEIPTLDSRNLLLLFLGLLLAGFAALRRRHRAT